MHPKVTFIAGEIGSGKSTILEAIATAYGGKYLYKQSHGESFFSVFMNRFRGNGLYILDEPEVTIHEIKEKIKVVRNEETEHY